MIKLFISDIDGCLAEPYQPYDLVRFQELATLIQVAGRLGSHDERPAFSLCSGRAYPYVEAMTQALGVQVPVLFESGGGMFDPVAAQIVWHPNFTAEVEAQLQAIRQWLMKTCLSGTGLMYDYGKRTQAGIMGSDAEAIYAQVPIVEQYVAKHFPDMCVFHTPISLDVVPEGITKAQGMQWLSDKFDCPLQKIAFIGDTNGDIGALNLVGHAFAPSNATEGVKQCVDYPLEVPSLSGVLMAYQWCINANQNTT